MDISLDVIDVLLLSMTFGVNEEEQASSIATVCKV